MRYRMAFVASLIALVLVMALPGATLAGTFNYSILATDCGPYVGQGAGWVYLNVKATEHGWSGANKITLTGTFQRRKSIATAWRTEANLGTFTKTFKDDGGNNSYTRWFEYHHVQLARHRIKVVAKAWHGTTLLAARTIYSDAC